MTLRRESTNSSNFNISKIKAKISFKKLNWKTQEQKLWLSTFLYIWRVELFWKHAAFSQVLWTCKNRLNAVGVLGYRCRNRYTRNKTHIQQIRSSHINKNHSVMVVQFFSTKQFKAFRPNFLRNESVGCQQPKMKENEHVKILLCNSIVFKKSDNFNLHICF